MGLNNLDHLLGHLRRSPGWEQLRRYQLVKEAWQKVIDPRLQDCTKPLGIQRSVLTVAVISPALAQNLQLQRINLLAKLNRELTEPLEDLRFSPLHWHQQHSGKLPEASAPMPRPAPPPPGDRREKVTSAAEALEKWLTTLKERAEVLQSCPQCGSAVNPGEIERWGCCSVCATKPWREIFSQSRPEKDGHR
ncbi:DUF721 domain-containing protein [Synechocystis salina]|uniref:DUF721 domain-containing protein n=1 Tax=Synechocystis salina LEGE 00031 TaxID=1828736 RepID=A0ABR9VQL8_9SYNC|nr:DciA family protein [Synechocystis salina]MBE9240138.1 DUF721 domain-containing protein [Synechocystis salina LEGE 00041]MBE9253648.1 DUF721 domain-containing protein [Synechocystis salina LEGE 00031]